MPKRRPAFDPAQLGFSFDAPRADVAEGALADLERVTASAVASILKEDPRSRYEVAGQVSALLDADVSKATLDKYCSEASPEHNVSFARALALVVATRRYDVLDALLRRIGCALLRGEEIELAEIGHLEAQRREIDKRLKGLKAVAEPLKRGDRR
jgi:hypothetical protein